MCSLVMTDLHMTISPSPCPGPPSLASIPSELLDEIAFHTSLSNGRLGPPHPLISLLLTCKTIHTSLSTSVSLYAQIFRAQFDTSALFRRFPREWLTSQCLFAELRRRWTSLKRLRKTADSWESKRDEEVLAGYSAQDITGDMWTALLMLMESDGSNYEQVVKWAKLRSFLDAYSHLKLLPLASEVGFQPETVASSLAIWLSWFTTDPDVLNAESPSQYAENAGLIRPFVFGAHRYDPYFAPWVLYQLPLSPDVEGEEPQLPPRYQETPRSAYIAVDLELRDNRQIVHYLHRQLILSAPIMCHAAIMSLFLRIQAGAGAAGADELAGMGNGNRNGPVVAPTHPAHVGGANGTPNLAATPVLHTDSALGSGHYATTNDSKVYDVDFNRLTACLNPYVDSYPSERLLYKVGTLHGVWEGRFAFFDFDAYQDMLVGQRPPALVNQNEMMMGQQPQVWRLSEYHLYPSSAGYIPRTRASSTPSSSPRSFHSKKEASPSNVYPLPAGPPLRAHIPEGTEFVEVSDGLEVYVEGKTTCLFYKKYIPRDMQNGTGGRHGRKGTAPSHTSPDDRDHLSSDSDEDEEEEDKETILDTLFAGTGHSAWGPFRLRGRMRPWDGMVSLLKDYAGPQGRGQWLYRGYVHAGRHWVGRWRDTITEIRYTGYEGAFGMTARR